MNKPYHLMTPAERTLARIAQNRASAEKIAVGNAQSVSVKPAGGSADSTRMTPDERAKLGTVIRKVQS